jgi:hypothetical protein
VEELVQALTPFAQALPVSDDAWRVVSTARRIVARDLTTIDGDPVLELHGGTADRAEQTVPPAVYRARTRGTSDKRVRSTIAFGVAIVLALGGAALAPRWMSARVDAASQLMAPPPVNEAELAPTKSVEPSADEATAEESAVEPTTNVAKPTISPVSTARPLNTATRAPVSSASARTSAYLVHGGISNPGF